MHTLLPHGDVNPTYKSSDDIAGENIQGSNCYSYAFNHIALNGKRPHKAVPGFMTTFVTDKRYPSTHWQKCSEDIPSRVVDDGLTVSRVFNLGVDTVKIVRGSTVKKKLMKKPEHSYRRVVMVLAPSKQKDQTTDFHFYAQRVVPITELYNLKLNVYASDRNMTSNNAVNAYHSAKIHPLSSNLQIDRNIQMGNKHCQPISNSLDRSKHNIKLHAQIMPRHMLSFVPDPFWLLDIQPHEQKSKNIRSIINDKKSSLTRDLPKHTSIIRSAVSAALKNKTYPKNGHIGLWMHKLGWGTRVLNTDGDGKLIFDPMKANKCHGGFDYTVVCGVFDVLIGYGMTTPWHNLKMMKKNKLKNFNNKNNTR